jgi:hypothetical protein
MSLSLAVHSRNTIGEHRLPVRQRTDSPWLNLLMPVRLGLSAASRKILSVATAEPALSLSNGSAAFRLRPETFGVEILERACRRCYDCTE